MSSSKMDIIELERGDVVWMYLAYDKLLVHINTVMKLGSSINDG